MDRKRRESTYILRIWQEPSELSPPGEWRGVLRSMTNGQERFFKSAQELWDLLMRNERSQTIVERLEDKYES